MKKTFLSISYKNKNTLSKEIACIVSALKELSIKTVVFVHKYSFKSKQEKKMMKIAFEEIKNSDILIAEASDKAIGIGIEIGYAKALNKLVVYLRKEDSEYSTTVGGTADVKLTYKNINDLKEKLLNLLIPR